MFINYFMSKLKTYFKFALGMLHIIFITTCKVVWKKSTNVMFIILKLMYKIFTLLLCNTIFKHYI